MSRIASVLLPMPLPEAFDYAEPEGMGLELGDQVAAPLGPRLLRGVVVGLREAAGGGRPLAIALRGARAPKPRPLRVLEPTGAKPARMTPAREKVLAAAGAPLPPA